MKNIILVFMLFFMAGRASAVGDWLSITELNITQVNTTQLSVNLKVESPNLSNYNSYTTSISGNVVTLKVCYNLSFATMPSYHDNNFDIEIPSASGNYTFKVEIYGASSGVCIYDTSHLEDSASLDFTNPFIGTISLSATDFENKDKNVNIYPNPVKDILHFSEEIANVKITDLSGKMIKQFTYSGKSIDVSSLAKGNYMITIVTKTGGTISKKLIKK